MRQERPLKCRISLLACFTCSLEHAYSGVSPQRNSARSEIMLQLRERERGEEAICTVRPAQNGYARRSGMARKIGEEARRAYGASVRWWCRRNIAPQRGRADSAGEDGGAVRDAEYSSSVRLKKEGRFETEIRRRRPNPERCISESQE